MRGFNLVEQGHLVMMLQPTAYSAATGTSTLTSELFTMQDYARAQILIHLGTVADSLTVTLLESTSSSAGDGTAIAFNFYPETDSGGDAFGARTAGSASGYVLGGTANTMYVIDVADGEMTDGSPWLGIQIAGVGTAGDNIGAVALLTGGRHQQAITATAIS